MPRRKLLISQVIIIAILTLLLSSCQLVKGELQEDQNIDITVWLEYESAVPESQFFRVMERVLKGRFPSIKIVYYGSYERIFRTLKDDLLANPRFDLAISSEYTMPMLYRIGLMSPIYTDGVEQLDQIEELFLDNIRSMNSERHDLYAVPISAEYVGMFYSPEQFQSLGLSPPEDGMTWEQLIALGQEIGGTTLFTNREFVTHSMSQLGLRFMNPRTNKIDVQNEEWVHYATKLQQLFLVPGNTANFNNIVGFHYNSSPLLSIRGMNNNMIFDLREGFHLDILSAPIPESNPEAGVDPMMFAAFIHPDSKRQFEAMEVINYLLSTEAQSMLSSKGRGSVLRDEAIRQLFGSNVVTRYMQGANYTSLTKNIPVATNRLEIYISRDMYFTAESVLPRLIVQSVDQTLADLDQELNKVLREDELLIEMAIEARNQSK